MMKNHEIDSQLALAIGYADDRVRVQQFWHKGDYKFAVQVLNDNSRMDGPIQYGFWQRFDHTDPAVIWPIAERFKAFPEESASDKTLWVAFVQLPFATGIQRCANPATATALAVIEHCKKGQP